MRKEKDAGGLGGGYVRVASNGPRRLKWLGVKTEEDGGGGNSVRVETLCCGSVGAPWTMGWRDRMLRVRDAVNGGGGRRMPDVGCVVLVIFVGTHCTRSDG